MFLKFSPLLLAIAGCSVITGSDLNSLHETSAVTDGGSTPTGGDEASTVLVGSDAGPADTTKPFQTLRCVMEAMTPHNKTLFEFRVIDENNQMQVRAFLDPPGTDNFTVTLANAIPTMSAQAKNWRLDFYGDVDGSRSYDGIGSVLTNDHAWRIDPLEDYPTAVNEPDVVNVHFIHNTTFTDIDQWPSGTKNPSKAVGLDFDVNFTGMDNYVGKILQTRVFNKMTGHVLGLYRFYAIPSPSFTASVPGVLDVSTDYTVEVYIDANGDGAYQDPSAKTGDLGWVSTQTSGMTAGLSYNFDPTTQTELGNAEIGPL